MSLEAKREYRKWRFLVDRSRMPDFYDFQNNEIKMIIAGMFEKSADLEEFARIIMSIRPVLNNPDAFDKWMKNEEIEFKEPPIQEDMNEVSTSQSSSYDNSAEKRLPQTEGKTPDGEPKPKRAKKDELEVVNDMYQLNPSLLTDPNDSLVSHPDFRLGNIRAAAIECRRIFNKKDKNVTYGVDEMIRKTVVCLMAQLFKHNNTRKYTAAPQRLKKGMTEFPEQVSAKIAAGMIKLIEMRSEDAAKMDSETDVKISEDRWKKLIYDEIEHVLKYSPERDRRKPLFEQISDEDYICKLKLDQKAVNDKWYENASTNYDQDAEMRNVPQQEHAQVMTHSTLAPDNLPQTQASNTTGQIIQPWTSSSFVHRPVPQPMQTSIAPHYTTQPLNTVLNLGVQQFTEQTQLPSTSAQSFQAVAPKETLTHGAAIVANALEKGTAVPVINNKINELAQNGNSLQVGGDNSFDNSHKILFYCPVLTEWRGCASVAYFKGKFYYLGGWDPETRKDTDRVDLLMDGIVKRYIDYQTMNGNGLKLENFQKHERISELHR
ncbi:hypothetical protein WR25_06216 [Diploscapter pachys]|uniref:Uncharacterized protein n=1 Tax=Diploscapter pachys TaxID=2018661 RepID=A0A2A2M0W2_9BILA|nr:hypothetical protein WR25_06216 [Diploscapter pachys]